MKHVAQLCLWGLVTLALTGCATTSLEADYGTSYHRARGSQILHPEASANLQPVSGLDGTAAQEAFDRYRKSFALPPPAPRFVLPIGELGK